MTSQHVVVFVAVTLVPRLVPAVSYSCTKFSTYRSQIYLGTRVDLGAEVRKISVHTGLRLCRLEVSDLNLWNLFLGGFKKSGNF